jgi:hypothetical protein
MDGNIALMVQIITAHILFAKSEKRDQLEGLCVDWSTTV